MKRVIIIFLIGGLVAFFVLRKMKGIVQSKPEIPDDL